MQENNIEKEIWMMRANLRTVLDNVSACRVYLKDIELELWKMANGFALDRRDQP